MMEGLEVSGEWLGGRNQVEKRGSAGFGSCNKAMVIRLGNETGSCAFP